MDKKKEFARDWLRNRYPIVICADRYGGIYSDGKWDAFPEYEVPPDSQSDDVTCMHYWTFERKQMIGLGNTPQEAYEDLVKKLENFI